MTGISTVNNRRLPVSLSSSPMGSRRNNAGNDCSGGAPLAPRPLFHDANREPTICQPRQNGRLAGSVGAADSTSCE
jgi:hypothetical protein